MHFIVHFLYACLCAFRCLLSDLTDGAAGTYFAYCFCTKKIRPCSGSCGDVLRVLLLYLNVATLQPDPCRRSRADCEVMPGPQQELTRCPHRVAREAPRFAREGSKSDAARTIPAKGHARTARIATPIPVARAPQESQPRRSPQRVARGTQESQKSFCASTTPIPRVARVVENHSKTTVFAPRPRPSPWRVSQVTQESQKKTLSFCASITPIPDKVAFSQSALGPTAPP